jgi:choline-sulfatase
VLLLPLLVACPAPPSITQPEGVRPDVVVVTLDTLRADRLGAYGYAPARSETIDALARDGIRFEQAISPLPLTIPAHATMFTGLFPYRHGIRSNSTSVLKPELTTLAETMKDNGWATGASVAAFVTTRQWGFAQGFDAYFDAMPDVDVDGDRNYWHSDRPAESVVDDALRWVAGQSTDTPLFLWVHLYDVHAPYVARPGYTDLKDPYDAEIAYVDDQVARLVEAFAGRDVLWVLVGDHGESLGEHAEQTHGLWSYQATQHVPFIVSGSGVKRGVVKDTVSTADVMPTVLRAVGLPVPEGLDGKPQPGSEQLAYAESYQPSERYRLAPHRTVVEGNLKLIATPKPELYDIVADPGERTNLAEKRPDDVVRLRAKLDALDAKPPASGSEAVDAETLAQLAQLGYTSGEGIQGDPLAYPDPKDHAEFLTTVDSLAAQKGGSPEGALAMVEKALALKPDAFELHMRRVQLLGGLKRSEEARDAIEEAARLFPDNTRAWVMLGSSALREGRFDDARIAAEKALAVDATDDAAHELYVESLLRLGRVEEGVAAAQKALQLDPRNFGVAAVLGGHHLSTRAYDEAEKLLRIAVSAPSPRRGARVQLAMMALTAKVRSDAYALLQSEIADYPGNYQAHRMIAQLYAEDEQWLDEKEHRMVILRARPEDPRLLRAVAQCDFNLRDYATARTRVDQALAVAPDDPDTLLLHANLLAKEGNREEGAAVFERARQMHEARVKQAAARQAGATSGSASPSKAAPAKETK